MKRLKRLVVCLAIFAVGSNVEAFAQAPPQTLRLTRSQWACLQTRLPVLQRSESELVRVPLGPCGERSGTRGQGVGNTTAGRARRQSSDPSLTQSPLYLTHEQLACVERQLPSVTRRRGTSAIDLTQCD
ncbi:hypothetical protein DSM104635_00454 [Terricaulis silvestris]|uniref:YARHG domain-containing protein n=1 Tax=Terricaulis silvestris TaxID=2686094 RepID=A0A6I6MQ34_9CAUL|nr:hypothetical protein DSM104635_00454 [Terricaulis silvestris]